MQCSATSPVNVAGLDATAAASISSKRRLSNSPFGEARRKQRRQSLQAHWTALLFRFLYLFTILQGSRRQYFCRLFLFRNLIPPRPALWLPSVARHILTSSHVANSSGMKISKLWSCTTDLLVNSDGT